jgi:hypothetical protein
MPCRTPPLLPILIAAIAGWTSLPAQTTPPVRRFIAAGGDHPTPAEFRQHLAEFEKLPFDGAVIRPLRRLADGTEQPASPAFSRDPWQPAEIEAMVADLKEAKPSRARDNFLLVQAHPGDVDWFDDTGWRETVDHWRLLARAAKLGGLRGLCFDPEPATAAASIFNYQSQPRRAGKDFAAYAKIARDRGREVMLAVGAEFPEAVIVCHRLYSDLLPLVASEASPAALLPAHPWGLLPAFADGWWDAAPPKLLVVEGNQEAGFRANSEAEFNRAYTLLRTQAARLAAPEHRLKLRAQLLIGQGLVLDAYLNPRGSARFVDPLGGPPESRLAANAAAALRASDGWVWIDGDTGRWWPAPAAEETAIPWADRFPGAAAAIARARTPAAAARERLATASPAENRLANADFSKAGKENLPASWWTWQRDDSRGTARREAPVTDANQPATVTWSAAAEAVFGQDLAVKAGEAYALGTRVKSTGEGIAALKVGWKDAKGQWTAADANVTVPPEGPPDADGWHALTALVRVPTGASQLVFMLGTQGQTTAEDRAVFAQAMAVRL